MLMPAALLVLVAVAAPGAATPTPSSAEPVVCPPTGLFCVVTADSPADAGKATAGVSPVARRSTSGAPGCRAPGGAPMPCQDPAFGWFDSRDGCYYRPVEPPPDPSDPVWEGRYPQGAVYQFTCAGTSGTGGGWVWRATPPPGAGPAAATPEQLAQQAVRQLALTGPDIRTAPPQGAPALVNAPIWLWTDVTATTWGPASATASVPGMSVTATARAERIVWTMGDGQRVTCLGPGTPYDPSLQRTTSPTCGYVYRRSSADQPGARYPVTATTTWRVTWQGGGATGALTATRTSTTQIQVAELQVLS